jgi:hypothetical protein
MSRFRRVLVKLSGGAFSGPAEFGFDKTAVDLLASELMEVAQVGVQLGVVVGSGNIFRGRLADQWGIERAEADNIGIMATVVNSLIPRGAVSARSGPEVRVMTASPINVVAAGYQPLSSGVWRLGQHAWRCTPMSGPRAPDNARAGRRADARGPRPQPARRRGARPILPAAAEAVASGCEFSAISHQQPDS